MKILLRAVAALLVGWLVFTLAFLAWATVVGEALQAGGMPYLFIANRAMMITIGVALGISITLVASHRDFVTPIIAGLILFGLGLIGIAMIAGDLPGATSVRRTTIDVYACWLAYFATAITVFLVRKRVRDRKLANQTAG